MRPFDCPICRVSNPAGAHLCVSCGADFSDPDVLAMASAPGASASFSASRLGGAGVLADTRLLGFNLDGLVDGSGLRKLAGIGGAILLLSFLLPLTHEFRDWLWGPSTISKGPTFAALYPLVAGIIGLAVAFAPRLKPWVRAAILVGTGLLGALVALAPYGKYAGTSEHALPLLFTGLLLAGAGIATRLFYPRAPEARYALALGSLLAIVAMVIPRGDTGAALPVEFRFYLDSEFRDMSLLSAYSKGFGKDAMVMFGGLLALTPVWLLPLTTGLAWATPREVWDRGSFALRPMAWSIVLFIPVMFAFLAFNVTGWEDFDSVIVEGRVYKLDAYTDALLAGRVRLAAMIAFPVLWVQLGAVALYAHFRAGDRDVTEEVVVAGGPSS